MSDIQKWSEIAAENSEAPPDGTPEGMKRSDVNNAAREAMRAIRKFYAAGEFTIVYDTVGAAWTVSKFAALVVRLTPADAQTTDISGRFPDGSRIKVTSAGADLFGFVVSTTNSVGILDITVIFDKAADVVPATPTGIELGFLRDSVEKTAFYPTGATLAQEPPNVPTIDDLGDGATLDQGTGGGFDADLLDGLHAAQIIASASTGARNIVYNGEFMVWQRGTPIDNDTTLGRIYQNDNGNYTSDRWQLLSGQSTSKKNNVVDVSRNTVSPPLGAFSALTFTGTSAVVAGDFAGIFQILEARDAASLIGSTSISMGMDMKQTGGIINARFMLLGWDGTVDTPTADPISDWQTAGDPTGPTLVANWKKLADSTQLTIGSAWVRQTLEGVDISVVPNIKNLAIFIYIDDTAFVVGDTLHVTNIKVENGGTASQYNHVEHGTELSRCQRYFLTTFTDGADPRRQAGLDQCRIGSAHSGVTSSPFFYTQFVEWLFPTEMFKTPTPNYFNPVNNVASELAYKPFGGTIIDVAVSLFTTNYSSRVISIWDDTSAAANDASVIYTGMTVDAEF